MDRCPVNEGRDAEKEKVRCQVVNAAAAVTLIPFTQFYQMTEGSCPVGGESLNPNNLVSVARNVASKTLCHHSFALTDAQSEPGASTRPAIPSLNKQRAFHNPQGRGQGGGDMGVPLRADVLQCHAQKGGVMREQLPLS